MYGERMAPTGYVEDSQQTDNTQRIWSWIIGIICILFAIFQIYTAGFGRYPNLIQRSVHAGFALILTYLMVPASKTKAGRPRPTILNISLAVASAILCFYIGFIWFLHEQNHFFL
jgi:TRAP-type uncharacterized transport system fused permease subunit